MVKKPRSKKSKKHASKVEAFWKRNPELRRVAAHIGKLIDKIEPGKIPDMILSAFIGYAGYKAIDARWPKAPIQTKIANGSLTALLCYKLATAPNNLPAQIAGLGGLATYVVLGATAGLEPTVDDAKSAQEFALEESMKVTRRGPYYLPVG